MVGRSFICFLHCGSVSYIWKWGFIGIGYKYLTFIEFLSEIILAQNDNQAGARRYPFDVIEVPHNLFFQCWESVPWNVIRSLDESCSAWNA